MRDGLALGAVCFAWGTIPFLAAEADVPPSTIVFARVWFAAFALGVAVLVVRTRQPRPPAPPAQRRLAVRCLVAGLVLAGHWTAMFAAYERAPDGTVIFVVFLAPVIVGLVERPGRRLLVALAVALAGFTLIASPTLQAPDPDGRTAAGLLLAGVAAVLFAVLVLLAKPLAEAMGGLRLTLVEMVVAGVALAPVVALRGAGDWRAALPWLAVLGLVHTAIGTAVYLHVLARVPATEVGILGYLEPIGVVVFTWLLLGDAPSTLTVAGGALVIAAGMLTVRGSGVGGGVGTPAVAP